LNLAAGPIFIVLFYF